MIYYTEALIQSQELKQMVLNNEGSENYGDHGNQLNQNIQGWSHCILEGGSPTVSPVIAAWWASEPLPP